MTASTHTTKLRARARQLAQQVCATEGILPEQLTTPLLQRRFAELCYFYEQDLEYNRLAYFEPYEYQRPLYHLHTRAQAVIASNRSGKSYSVGYAIACHLTGRYPQWWTDIRYDTGIKLIAAGASSSQIREAIQETLFGTADKTDVQALGTGLIPRDCIVQDSLISGSDRRAVAGAQIRHVSNTVSTISIASYEQDRAVLQGGKADVIWLDEQPSDDAIVSELIRALAQTPTGQEGRLYLSATPLVGWTAMIRRFWNAEPHHGMVRYTWADVPLELLDQGTRDLLMASWLPWERAARTEGIPMAGEGAVFQVDIDACVDTVMPRIGVTWPRIAGIDFGRSPDPTVVIWMAQDPNTGVIYIYDEMVARNQTPIEYAPFILSRQPQVALAWPPDGRRRGYTETTSAVEELRRYGVRLLPEPFTNPDGSRGIDYGLQQWLQLMRVGRLRISSHCQHLLSELRQYHTVRADSGRVQFRGNDHCIDATRYALMMLERAGVSELAGTYEPEDFARHQRWLDSFAMNHY